MNDILIQNRGMVAILTMNRPDVLNAFRRNTLTELIAAFDNLEQAGSVRVAIMTGSGRAFCAGQDLKELEQRLSGAQPGGQDLTLYSDLTRRIVHSPIATIAALNGVAVGLGAEIAIACDIRIASETAHIGFVEAKRALFQTNGVLYLLPRIVGRGRALELVLTGEMISATHARTMGLITSVSPPAEMMSDALTLAEGIASNAPISVRTAKDLLNRTYDLDLEQVMALELQGVETCLASDDAREGNAAFREKRPPSYKGI